MISLERRGDDLLLHLEELVSIVFSSCRLLLVGGMRSVLVLSCSTYRKLTGESLCSS